MNKKRNSFKSNIRQLKPFISPYKWRFIIAILMIVVFTASLASAPTFEGKITSILMDNVQAMGAGVPGASVDFSAIFEIILFLLVIYAIKTGSQIISTFCLTNAIQNAMRDMRNALQDKIRRLPVRYFDQNQFGDVLSRITNDVDAVSNALQQTLPQVLSGILLVTFAITMMFSINVTMALVVLLIFPIAIIVSRFIIKHSQKRFKAQQDALGKLNGAITEMYTGNKEIMLFNKQQDSIEKFKVINENLRSNAFIAQFVSSTITPLISLATYLVMAIIGVLGSIFAIQGVIKIGQLQAFTRYIWQINDPVSQVSSLSSQMQAAFAAMERIFEVFNEADEEVNAKPTTIANVQGDVTFNHVRFGYGKDIIIQDLNVEVKSGQMIAVVGPTGSGKTTLINLLMRFYDVNSGSIVIDGVDIRTMDREYLRSLFAMVLQDTWLFSGSIYDNIRYGRLEARKDEVIEAAKLANVHHFIRTLPNGYDNEINEEGSNISQGEKQLLTIARAIVKNPQILILDEATSSVDTRLEKMLQEAMHNVMKGRTSFVIAHRLSTIKSADLILVMKDGVIIEQGTHEQLIQQNGFYEQLYNAQFASQE